MTIMIIIIIIKIYYFIIKNKQLSNLLSLRCVVLPVTNVVRGMNTL